MQSKQNRFRDFEWKLPSLEKIVEEIEISKKNARMDAKSLKLLTKKESLSANICECDIKPIIINKPKQKADLKQRLIIAPEVINNYLQFRRIELTNFADKFHGCNITENSKYVELNNENKKRMVVKKTSLCWLLRKDYQKLSSDRLRRVMYDPHVKCKQRNQKTICLYKISLTKKNKHINK